MTRDDIIRLAREAGLIHYHDSEGHWTGVTNDNLIEVEENRWDDKLVKILEPFANLVAAAEREACAKACEEKTAYQMQIPCPDGIPGCLVFHAIEAKREKTGSECAAAIRARGELDRG